MYKSFVGGTRGRLSSAKSYESLTSNGDAKSMVTALSGGSDEEERASTPTEQLDGGEIKMLQTQLELARDKINVLEAEVEQLKRDSDQNRPRSRLDSSDSKQKQFCDQSILAATIKNDVLYYFYTRYAS